MNQAAQTTTFMDFPDFIVPGGTPITDLSKRAKQLDGSIADAQEKLERIKQEKHNGVVPERGSMNSSAYNNVAKKLADLSMERKQLYLQNRQWNWAKQFMDACINYSNYCFNAWDERVYQYMDARVVETDFAHITELYAGPLGKTAPAEIRQVNQFPAIVNRIMGEADAMGIKFGVSVINTEAVNDKMDEYAQKTADIVTKWKRQKGGLQQYLGAPLEEEDAWESDNPELAAMSFSNYKTDKEVMVKRGLDYLMQKPNLAIKHRLVREAFRNYIGTGKFCVHVWDALDDPDIMPVDSRNLIYLLSPSNPFIQHGMMAGYYFQETPQGIIDRCPEMNPADVAKLRDYAKQWADGGASPTYVGRNGEVFVKRMSTMQPLYLNCWKLNFRATKRVRVQVVENKFDLDNPHLKYVDDNANEKGATYYYKYVDEIWEGERYGTEIYYQMRPIPNQHIVGDYVERKTLNFIGIVDPNPSLGQLCLPFESLRVQAFYTYERLMAQARPDTLIIDEASESDDADNAYNMHVNGTFRYNSAREGDMQLAGIGVTKQINKPEILRSGISQTANDILRFIAFLDNCIANITGITGARKGELKSDTGMGQMEQANMASSMSTQPYFTTFYTCVGMVLEKLCEQMGRTWAGKDIVKMWEGANGYETLRLMSASEWNLPRYGIFVENSANDQQLQSRIYEMATKLLPIANEPDLALALIKILRSDSAQEAERVFEKGIEATKKIKKKQGESEQMQAQMETALAKAQEDNKNLREKIKAAAGVQEAQIVTQGKLEDTKLKLENKGQLSDAKKKDAMDLMIAEHTLKEEHKEK
jgi:hypothetical protein